MNWNYLGIDPDPPKRTQLVALFEDGTAHICNSTHPLMIAWTLIPPQFVVKRNCQIILRGLPELRMIPCIVRNEETLRELVTAVAHYDDESLAQFTDLVRALDRKAHNGTPCIENFHR